LKAKWCQRHAFIGMRLFGKRSIWRMLSVDAEAKDPREFAIVRSVCEDDLKTVARESENSARVHAAAIS
jgi:hypothetical protein